MIRFDKKYKNITEFLTAIQIAKVEAKDENLTASKFLNLVNKKDNMSPNTMELLSKQK